MKERNYIINYKIRAGGVIHIKAKNVSISVEKYPPNSVE